MKKYILLFLFLLNAFMIDSDVMEESKLKSIFIYQIGKFTRWPQQTTDPDTPFVISIIGKTSPGSEIDIPGDKTIDNREILIRKISKLQEVPGSDVLFVTNSEAYRLETILDHIGNIPVLTFGDTEGFAERGVIVNFCIENNKLRFEINLEAVKKASLHLEFRLVKLAVRVFPQKKGSRGK
ncbi:MAG: YfiR family protein [Candidatus Aminicenantes bacterium]|nr:YfiR family protein [Candidatus Aminicenantes bacterium]